MDSNQTFSSTVQVIRRCQLCNWGIHPRLRDERDSNVSVIGQAVGTKSSSRVIEPDPRQHAARQIPSISENDGAAVLTKHVKDRGRLAA